MSESKIEVNQSKSRAGRDLVTIVNYHESPISPSSAIESLLEQLEKEIAENNHVQETIESLKHYYAKKSADGIDGLENKLKYVGRDSEIDYALDKKEEFSKLLEKWSMYASAQEILVHLLARVEYEFRLHVIPHIEEDKINEIITLKIVEPVVAECGSSVFKINHGTAMGMLYWLAEQCYIRWHK